MTDKELIIVDEMSLRKKIYEVRGEQVMMDSDLAEVYGYETRYLNLQVKHNLKRFPDDFMFQLTQEEYDTLMLKNSTSNRFLMVSRSRQMLHTRKSTEGQRNPSL